MTYESDFKMTEDRVAVAEVPLDVGGAHEFLNDPGGLYGATVVFLGRVRRWTDAKNTGYTGDVVSRQNGRPPIFEPSPTSEVDGRTVVETPQLYYECYPEMAQQAMRKLLDETRRRWPVGRQILLHRVGQLSAGEVAIVIGVSSSHRAAAYQANQYLIDEVKQRVPVWKKEIFACGGSLWTHPVKLTT